jgi:hypothetical protein
LINFRNFGSRLVGLLRKLLLLFFEGKVENKSCRGCDIAIELNLQQVDTLQILFVGEYDFDSVICWLFCNFQLSDRLGRIIVDEDETVQKNLNGYRTVLRVNYFRQFERPNLGCRSRTLCHIENSQSWVEVRRLLPFDYRGNYRRQNGYAKTCEGVYASEVFKGLYQNESVNSSSLSVSCGNLHCILNVIETNPIILTSFC